MFIFFDWLAKAVNSEQAANAKPRGYQPRSVKTKRVDNSRRQPR